MAAPVLITADCGATWSVAATPANPYGRATPAGREFWASMTGAQAMPAGHPLAGVVGFYAPTIEAARSRILVAS
jgi:hypothetical protein